LFKANFSSLPSEDPLYQKKKKAIKGAMFKSKMGFMSGMMKKCALKAFAEIQDQGNENIVDI